MMALVPRCAITATLVVALLGGAGCGEGASQVSDGGAAGASAAGAGGSAGTGAMAGTNGSAGRGGSGVAGSGAGGAPIAGTDGGTRPCPGAKPDASNTGVPAGVTLTVVNQDVTVTQDNTTIDAQDIHGFLIIQASHVHVTRSIVRGRATGSNAGVINVKSGTDVVIEDTEIAVASPSATVDGMWGQNFIARRMNIHGGVDGMKADTNDSVECSYIHDLASFASDPNQGGGPTHNDGIQILSGTGIHIVGNQLVAAMDQNSAIQVTQDFGAVSDLHIDSNWADGGGCTFNFAHKVAASLTVNTSNNRFGRNSFYECPILKSTQTTLVSSGDVWDNDGTPVPVQTHD